ADLNRWSIHGEVERSKPIPCPSQAGWHADRRHRDESVELARFQYRAWRRAPAVEEARCRRDRIAKATASMARGSRESRTQDRTHCSRLRGWSGWFLAGALVEDTRHRGPRYSRIERSRIARAPTRQDRPARHRGAQTRLSWLAARRA